MQRLEYKYNPRLITYDYDRLVQDGVIKPERGAGLWMGVIAVCVPLALLFSFPIYLIVAAISSLDLLPTNSTELLVWVGLAVPFFSGAMINNRPARREESARRRASGFEPSR